MPKPIRLSNFHVMSERQLSSTVTAYLGQDEVFNTRSGRSKYLAVVLYKSDTKDLIKLRLSTVRRLFKFMSSKGLLTARRLTFVEKLINRI